MASKIIYTYGFHELILKLCQSYIHVPNKNSFYTVEAEKKYSQSSWTDFLIFFTSGFERQKCRSRGLQVS
jgi:hypothetical protein